jgi:hypothetical protein
LFRLTKQLRIDQHLKIDEKRRFFEDIYETRRNAKFERNARRDQITVFRNISKCSPILGLVFVEDKHFDSLEKKAHNCYQYLE